MMKYLASADEQRNHQEATAPENSKTANMVNLEIERLQQLVQQPPSEYASTDPDDESAMAETSDSESSVENMRYRARGRRKDKKGRRHWHCSRSPSTSPSRSPPKYLSKFCARRSGSRKPDKQDITPTNCTHCKEFGGYGLAHTLPKSVTHKKCNYNKKWKGWRPEWVCKNIGVAYKEHYDCNELRDVDLDKKHSKDKWTKLTTGNKITKNVASYDVHLSNAYAKLAEFSADPGPPPEDNTKKTETKTTTETKFKQTPKQIQTQISTASPIKICNVYVKDEG